MVVVKAIKSIKGLAAAVFMKSHAMKKKAVKRKAAEAVKANRSMKATKSKPRWVLRVRRWVAGLGVQALVPRARLTLLLRVRGRAAVEAVRGWAALAVEQDPARRARLAVAVPAAVPRAVPRPRRHFSVAG